MKQKSKAGSNIEGGDGGRWCRRFRTAVETDEAGDGGRLPSRYLSTVETDEAEVETESGEDLNMQQLCVIHVHTVCCHLV